MWKHVDLLNGEFFLKKSNDVFQEDLCFPVYFKMESLQISFFLF